MAASTDVKRCEGCGHPLSDGAWVGSRPLHIAEGFDFLLLDRVVEGLRHGVDERRLGERVHYSPCDEGCTHGGPGRSQPSDQAGIGEQCGWNLYADLRDSPRQYVSVGGCVPALVEASWRGESADPNSCLRCWAAR